MPHLHRQWQCFKLLSGSGSMVISDMVYLHSISSSSSSRFRQNDVYTVPWASDIAIGLKYKE